MSDEKSSFPTQLVIAIVGLIGVTISAAIPSVVTNNVASLQLCFSRESEDKKQFVSAANDFMQAVSSLDNHYSGKEWERKNLKGLKDLKKKAFALYIHSPNHILPLNDIKMLANSEVVLNSIALKGLSDNDKDFIRKFTRGAETGLMSLNLGSITMNLYGAILKKELSPQDKIEAIIWNALWALSFQSDIGYYDKNMDDCKEKTKVSILSVFH